MFLPIYLVVCLRGPCSCCLHCIPHGFHTGVPSVSANEVRSGDSCYLSVNFSKK